MSSLLLLEVFASVVVINPQTTSIGRTHARCILGKYEKVDGRGNERQGNGRRCGGNKRTLIIIIGGASSAISILQQILLLRGGDSFCCLIGVSSDQV